MKGKITLCKWDQEGDIPEFDYSGKEQGKKLVHDFLKETMYGNEKTVVSIMFGCFGDTHYTEEHPFLFVSHSYTDCLLQMQNQFYHHESEQEFNYAIFQYETYEEAFRYCIDLKEGL